MGKHYLICRSITYAQRTARCLERKGYSAAIARLPANLGFGCGYGVLVNEYELYDMLMHLAQQGLRPKRVGVLCENGSFREILV